VAAELTKSIRRRVTLLLDNRPVARDRDRYVVSLNPDLTVGFRRLKSRKEIRVPLAVVYRQALIEAGKQEIAERKRRRGVRRGLLS
jgi:hypothetical protein